MKKRMRMMVAVVIVFILSTYTLAPVCVGQNDCGVAIRLLGDKWPYRFGFMQGINRLNYTLKTKPNLQSEYGFEQIQAFADYGIHQGIVANIRLSDHFDLRFIPTVLFSGVSFTNARYIEYLEPDGTEIHSVFEASYVEFPIHVKYNFPHMNYTRLYLTAGPKYTYALNIPKMVDPVDDSRIYTHLTRHDWYLEAGGGIHFYAPYVKFGVEIKASLGLRNLLESRGDQGPHYYNAIEHLRSRAILVSFYFE